MVYCSNCGNENEDGSAFCGTCGSKIIVLLTDQVSFNEAGRATRSEYWWWALFILLVGLFISLVTTFFLPSLQILSQLWNLATIIPSFAVGARRLHDIDKSAWWLFLWLAIFIGWIILIVWAIKKGDDWENQYGPPSNITPR